MIGMIRGAWRYRRFIAGSIANEFAVRFARSRLGTLWLIIHPLAQVAIFAFILSAVLSAKLPGIDSQFAYALYLMAGMLAWTLFSEVVTRGLTVFVDNGNLLKKIMFPRVNLPIVAAGAALVNNVLLLGAILLIFALLGHVPGAAALWLPVLILLNLALALGVGLVLGVLNVFARDIGQAVPIFLQFGFWLTPIVYTASILPEAYRPLLYLNPLVPVVDAYQRVLVFNEAPAFGPLALSGIAATVVLLLALSLFRRAAPEMVDVL